MTSVRSGDWILIGKFWYNTKTRQSMPVIQGGALPATDAFTGSDGTALTTYSASWTLNYGNFQINTNALATNGGDGTTDAAAHWNADAFGNDQYSQITVAAISISAYIGMCVRAAASAATFYNIVFNDRAAYLSKYIDGAGTGLANSITDQNHTAGDVDRLEIVGTTLTPKKNGGAWPNITAQTDNSIASGSAGVSGNGTATTSRMDDWEGGNLGGTIKSLTDTGAGVDQTIQISASLSRSDAGTGVDNPQLAASLNIADGALGGDFLDLSAALSLIESGIGADTLTQLIASLGITEISSSDDLLSLLASLSTSDTGTGSDEAVVSVAIVGSTVWGHVTGVEETNIRTFATNWTGTGQAEGSGDDEKLRLCEGDYMISEIVETGVIETTLLQNNYAAGDTVLLQYRTGATEADCLSAGWNTYTVPFESLGYVQVRVEYSL